MQHKVHACKQAAMGQRDDKMKCIHRISERIGCLWNERKRIKLMRNARFSRISNDRFIAAPNTQFEVLLKFDEFKECTSIYMFANAIAFIKWESTENQVMNCVISRTHLKLNLCSLFNSFSILKVKRNRWKCHNQRSWLKSHSVCSKLIHWFNSIFEHLTCIHLI